LRQATTTGYRLDMTPRTTTLLGLAVAALAVTAAAGCSSSSSPTAASSPSTTTSAKPTGSVSVAYASSLQSLNEKIAGPAFTSADGYTYSGQGNTSGALEAEIAGGQITPNVFEAVGGDNITPLEPKFTKWYVQYAGTQIVLAYNPNSKYASQFKAIANGTMPMKGLFTLLETTGLKLGRTDPKTDPQGRDFILMLELAQKYYNLPSNTVAKILGTSDLASATSSQIFAESSLDATLESGQLDAASAFISQAVQLHLSYIKLPSAINLGSAAEKAFYKTAALKVGAKTYHGSPQVIDVTIIGTPTPAATAFVQYTLSAAGLAEYGKEGFTLLAPKAFGDTSAIPSSIASELGS
jgi:molybdate/tungstate transport system substrate-binding protein